MPMPIASHQMQQNPALVPQQQIIPDILPIPPKQETVYPGFKLKLKVDDTDYYSKKLD
jgi:hypothetical protein